MTKSVGARELVLEGLIRVLVNNEYSTIVLEDILARLDDKYKTDKAFITRLLLGTVERCVELDYIISIYSNTPIFKMRPQIINILRMSVYQIVYMDSVPSRAVCNEAVNITKRRGFIPLNNFVNGLLRKIADNASNISYPSEDDDRMLNYSIIYSMPIWIVRLLIDEYGEETKDILSGMMDTRPIIIRLREGLKEEDIKDLLSNISELGIIIHKHAYLDYAYELRGAGDISRLPRYEEGLYIVQDVSSMLVGEVFRGIVANYDAPRVLDICAAPGGKATHMADILEDRGVVIARDISPKKVDRIIDNYKRLKLDNIKAQVWDACINDSTLHDSIDIMLCDLPCSGLGVIGRKPDIKYRLKETDIDELVVLQKRIIDTVSEYVKVGGTLIYSTCTLSKRENEQMVEWIVENYPYKVLPISNGTIKVFSDNMNDKGHIQLKPGINECDGFFIAVLERIHKENR